MEETEEKISVEDGSNDKSYFTMIPNYILNHSTATAQALYLQLKRLAGDNGIAFPSSDYLCEKLRISKPTLRKEMKYLLEKNWIVLSGQKDIKTAGGAQKINCYRIVDIWKTNVEFFSDKGGKNESDLDQRGEKIFPKGGKNSSPKKNPLNNIQGNTVFTKETADVINAFKEINPNSYQKWFNREPQRSSADRLIKAYGLPMVLKVIAILPKTNKIPYMPIITDVCKLEDKWASLEASFEKKKSEALQNKGRGLA